MFDLSMLRRWRGGALACGTGRRGREADYPKYSDPSARRDGEEIPEGLNRESWFEYANVDAPQYYFKGDVAVPWLAKVLKP